MSWALKPHSQQRPPGPNCTLASRGWWHRPLYINKQDWDELRGAKLPLLSAPPAPFYCEPFPGLGAPHTLCRTQEDPRGPLRAGGFGGNLTTPSSYSLEGSLSHPDKGQMPHGGLGSCRKMPHLEACGLQQLPRNLGCYLLNKYKTLTMPRQCSEYFTKGN